MAEVGVAAGEFSRVLLQSNLTELHLIDNWFNPEDEDKKSNTYALIDDPRVTIHETDSLTAAKVFKDNSLDLVYIDTMHDYDSCRQEMETWWPKCRHVLAGHDYGLWNHGINCSLGVIPAVEEFVLTHGVSVHITGPPNTTVADRLLIAYNALSQSAGHYGDNIPSWYIIK